MSTMKEILQLAGKKPKSTRKSSGAPRAPKPIVVPAKADEIVNIYLTHHSGMAREEHIPRYQPFFVDTKLNRGYKDLQSEDKEKARTRPRIMNLDTFKNATKHVLKTTTVGMPLEGIKETKKTTHNGVVKKTTTTVDFVLNPRCLETLRKDDKHDMLLKEFWKLLSSLVDTMNNRVAPDATIAWGKTSGCKATASEIFKSDRIATVYEEAPIISEFRRQWERLCEFEKLRIDTLITMSSPAAMSKVIRNLSDDAKAEMLARFDKSSKNPESLEALQALDLGKKYRVSSVITNSIAEARPRTASKSSESKEELQRIREMNEKVLELYNEYACTNYSYSQVKHRFPRIIRDVKYAREQPRGTRFEEVGNGDNKMLVVIPEFSMEGKMRKPARKQLRYGDDSESDEEDYPAVYSSRRAVESSSSKSKPKITAKPSALGFSRVHLSDSDDSDDDKLFTSSKPRKSLVSAGDYSSDSESEEDKKPSKSSKSSKKILEKSDSDSDDDSKELRKRTTEKNRKPTFAESDDDSEEGEVIVLKPAAESAKKDKEPVKEEEPAKKEEPAAEGADKKDEELPAENADAATYD